MKLDLVVADWKDTEHLLDQLKVVLKRYGVVLQRWDAGDDNTTVTLAKRRITQKQCSKFLSQEYGSDLFDTVSEEKGET